MVQHLHKTDGCEGWLFGRRSARSSSVLSATLLSAILAIGLPTAGARAQAVQFDERSIIFETNFTDCDVGVQIFFDGEGWKRVNLRGPNYQVILLVAAKLGLNRQGLTEGFFESEEPVIEELADLPGSDCDEPEDNFDDLLARFPEGRYVFVGRTVENEVIRGRATLTHDLPAAPNVTSPMEDDMVDSTTDLVVEWDEVTQTLPGLPGPVGAVNILAYQVIVEEDDVDDPKVFTVDTDASAREATEPASFLEPGTAYKVEVLAIEESGNQTITEVPFETM